MNDQQQRSAARDRRTQIRIDLRIPILVTLPGREAPVTAISHDISWGGALFLISEPLPRQAGPLRVVFPWKRDEHITAHAQLLRARPLADGRYLVAVRFISLSPRSQSRLERLLKMLGTGKSTIDHDDGNLVRELEVTVNDADELRRMLMQIAKGRHTVTVFDAYEPNQSIGFSIMGTRDLPGIRLRARVIDVRKSAATGFEWADLYTLSLEFEHPLKAIKAFVKLLLDQLPERERPSPRASEEAPEWLRSIPLAKPTSADLARQFGQAGKASRLETDYPEAINRLTAGWGDVDAFEIMFRDLVLGDHGHPGGWPEDAWEELELLQNIHDAAYGMSDNRRSLLKGGRKG